MNLRDTILVRAAIMYLLLAVLGIAIVVKIIMIQFVDGNKWKAYAKAQQTNIEVREAERGTIFSDEMEMLSSSIPYFNLHMDMRTPRLRKENGKKFYKNIDSFALGLSIVFKDKSKEQYEQELTKAYKDEEPYYLLRTKITYDQFNELRKWPLAKEGRNNNGIIEESFDKRLMPFGLMANRTIGLSRDPKNNVGLEKYYDAVLRGQSGSRQVQLIAGGVRVPISNTDIEPIKGQDVVTTLNVHVQDVVQQALHRMMKKNRSLYGTAIVMEVATGKIKAIANLGMMADSSYFEDNNYALMPTEPGSTIKLVTLMAGLEDGVVNINDKVAINGGYWNYGGRSIVDAERSPKEELSYKEAFVHSSNVAMSKLAALRYGKAPSKYLKHFSNLRLDQPTGIDLKDPYKPMIQNTKSKTWSAQTLASMGFGYEMRISPLQTLMVYNAIANNGKLMKPFLVSDIVKDGAVIQHIDPIVLNSNICSNSTLSQLKECLQEVCISGTAKKVFDSTSYLVAGKTGTTRVDDAVYDYDDGAYQSSFAGYFPADNPKYSCIVLIKNKPGAKLYMGGEVAAPVFKEIADQLVVFHKGSSAAATVRLPYDSARRMYATAKSDFITIAKHLQLPVTYGATEQWQNVTYANANYTTSPVASTFSTVPDVKGMGLKDALEVLESKRMIVKITGRGKVTEQSVPAGTTVTPKQKIELILR